MNSSIGPGTVTGRNQGEARSSKETMFVIALLCLLLASAQLLAAQSDNFVHPLTNMPPAAENVVTAFITPEHMDHKFPIGGTVNVLCHFRNDGDKAINVTGIMGSINLANDFRVYIWNNSFKGVYVEVQSNEEATFMYPFQMHPQLDIDTKLTMANTIFYEYSDVKGMYSSTFMNQTIDLYFPDSGHDLRVIASSLLAVIASALVIVALTAALNPKFGRTLLKSIEKLQKQKK